MRRGWTIFLLLCILTACTPVAGEPQSAPTPIPTRPHTPTPLPSQTSTETPTPTAVPSPTPLTCLDDGGVLVNDQVPSTLLPRPIDILVYLPPCYFQLPDAQFPALYLIHGQSFTQDQWVRLGAANIADDLIAAGEAAPFLIVMPAVSDWSQPADFPFGQALIEEVLPYLEAGYRANPSRHARAIGGISRGGSWALHLGARYWQTFSAVGGHSAPTFLGDDPYMTTWLDAIDPDTAPRIYLDVAGQDLIDIRRSTVWFAGELEERGIPYEFREPDGIHDESYWGAHVEEYLRFYTAGWKP